MASSTTLYRVDHDRFAQLRKRRLLRRLVDVLSGFKSPETIDLPGDHTFDSCSLGETWSELEPFLQGINQAPIVKGFKSWAHQIKHRRLGACYWQPKELIWGLSHVWLTVYRWDRSIRPFCSQPDLSPNEYGNIVLPPDLDKAHAVLRHLAEERMAQDVPWVDKEGEPFDSERAEHVLEHLMQAIDFMSQAACQKKGDSYEQASNTVLAVSSRDEPVA